MDTHNWYDDRREVAAFARWFFGDDPASDAAVNVFAEPWHWDREYAAFAADRRTREDDLISRINMR